MPAAAPDRSHDTTHALDAARRDALREHGYVKLDAAVPPDRVTAALRAINHSLGRGVDRADLDRFRAASFCPELQSAPVITDLYNATPARAAAESVIGAGAVAPVRGAQIALRFPEALDRPAPMHAHIDGMYYPGNGVRKGTIENFTALVGVLLSDMPAEHAGNFTVWPGTHALNAAYFRARGPQSLVAGMPQVAMPEPVQVTGRAGDVVLAHYLLSHGVASNLSPHVRYAVFFRLRRADHDRHRWESMADEWLQWDGMR